MTYKEIKVQDMSRRNALGAVVSGLVGAGCAPLVGNAGESVAAPSIYDEFDDIDRSEFPFVRSRKARLASMELFVRPTWAYNSHGSWFCCDGIKLTSGYRPFELSFWVTDEIQALVALRILAGIAV